MRIAIFGSGYVGLVTGACLADVGNHVVCVDIDAERVAGLQRGEVPIYEPGLEALVRAGTAAGRLEFTTDVAKAVEHGLFLFVAVGTPAGEDGSADLKHVLAVARSIGTHMREYRIVVNKSTVPVGTGDAVHAAIAEVLAKRGVSIEFDVVSNPEFLKEGAAVEDFMKPDRIVVGADNPRTAELLRALYDPFTRSRDRMVLMDVRSAEFTKYAANAMLATRISFMNEMANLGERLGVDIEQVRAGMGADPRIGYRFLYPGCGYGGSCFPKDVKALISSAEAVDYTPRILGAVEAVNRDQKRRVFDMIHEHFAGQLRGKTVALWGLAFKPNTDDMREAPSRELMQALWDAGAKVRAYDPVAGKEAARLYGDRRDFVLCTTADEALEGADVLAIVTEWREFRGADFDRLRNRLREATIFDGRNIYDPKLLKSLGFTYYAIGRGDSVAAVS